jgi:hypothetical protein
MSSVRGNPASICICYAMANKGGISEVTPLELPVGL